MAGFDYLFEGFTLLLGLAVAEALAGYVALLRLRVRARLAEEPPATRIGWLMPLLIAITLLFLSTFWIDMYQVREQLPFNLLTVAATLAFIGRVLHPRLAADSGGAGALGFARRVFLRLQEGGDPGAGRPVGAAVDRAGCRRGGMEHSVGARRARMARRTR